MINRILNFFPAILEDNKKNFKKIFKSNFGKNKVGKFQVYLYF